MKSQILKNNWWFLLSIVVASFLYSHFISVKKRCLQNLVEEMSKKDQELLVACETRESLQDHLVSQSDPAWVELILMRELGVVPEGWLKIHFKQ